MFCKIDMCVVDFGMWDLFGDRHDEVYDLKLITV
jgi:hypothetical protein